MAEKQWWACNCCGKRGPTPYSPPAPYDVAPGSGYYGPRSVCECCGRDSIVIIFQDAKNAERPPNRNIVTACTCGNPNLPFWTDLIGRSMTLDLCNEDCVRDDAGSEIASYKDFTGCAAFACKFMSMQRLPSGVDCPDVDGTIFLGVTVSCAYFPDGSRGIIAHGYGWSAWPGDLPQCKVYPTCENLNPLCGVSYNDINDFVGVGSLHSNGNRLAWAGQGCGSVGSVLWSPTAGDAMYGITQALVVV